MCVCFTSIKYTGAKRMYLPHTSLRASEIVQIPSIVCKKKKCVCVFSEHEMQDMQMKKILKGC